jgi:hypothetical protein
MSFRRSAQQRRFLTDVGSTASGFLIAIVVLAAVGVAAFFYFGGRANVDIKEPNVTVSGSASPS